MSTAPAFAEGTPPPGVVAQNLKRTFGPVTAVRDVSFVAPRGEVTALVGPNGAGKTTLLLMLASLLVPDAGTVRIAGHDPITETDDVRARMGWAPDVFGLYDNLTIAEYLKYAAQAYRISRDRIPKRVDELLVMAGLTEKANRPVHELSRGQKQRLALVRALVHEPDVLLLDEPASGLDPGSRIQLRQLLEDLAKSGIAVVISSHLLDDLEQMANSVVFINNGESVNQQQMTSLSSSQGTRQWRIKTLDDQIVQLAIAAEGLTSEATAPGAFEVSVENEEQAAQLLTKLIQADARISVFAPSRGAVEAEYLRMTGGN